jgi:hypothetical protein
MTTGKNTQNMTNDEIQMMESILFNLESFQHFYDKDITELTDIERTQVYKNQKNYEVIYSYIKDMQCVKYYDTHVFKSYTDVMYFEENVCKKGQKRITLKSVSHGQFESTIKCSKFLKFLFDKDMKNYRLILDPTTDKRIITHREHGIENRYINCQRPLKTHEKYIKNDNDEDSINFTFSYLTKVASDDDETTLNLLLSYLKTLLIGKKCDVMLYFYSPNFLQGIGKSSFVRLIEALIGADNVLPSNNSVMKERFNGSLYGYRVVVLDDFVPEHEVMEKTKAMITNDYIQYEHKNKDAHEGRCISSFIGTTNNVLNSEQKGGRRFGEVNFSPIWKGNTTNWDKLYQCLENSNVVSGIYERIMKHELKNGLQTILDSMESHKSSKSKMTPAIYKFIFEEYIQNQFYTNDIKVRSSEFNTTYDNWMINKRLNKQTTDTKQLLSFIGVEKKKISVEYYIFKKDNVVKRLIECNAYTEEQINDAGLNKTENIDAYFANDTETDNSKKLKQENDELKEQIKQLRKQLEEFQRKQAIDKIDNAIKNPIVENPPVTEQPKKIKVKVHASESEDEVKPKKTQKPKTSVMKYKMKKENATIEDEEEIEI